MKKAIMAKKDVYKRQASDGVGVPTIKPWNMELVKEKIDMAKAAGVKMIAMDIDAAGLPFLKNMTPPAGSKTVEELKEIIYYAGVPDVYKRQVYGMRYLRCYPARSWYGRFRTGNLHQQKRHSSYFRSI